jgi:hypothetical protein
LDRIENVNPNFNQVRDDFVDAPARVEKDGDMGSAAFDVAEKLAQPRLKNFAPNLR